ncbi:MAG TPA: aspartyl protease family protein [Nitrosopumilaceae archaeon]|nr:aspartyl protease family protein [Nitrosopumilaceae archaeon]
MRINALIDRHGQIRVPTTLYGSELGKHKYQMTFLVDTGANVTTILPVDAMRLGINFSKLKKSPNGVIGISGNQQVYVLRDVVLAFKKGNSNNFVYSLLDQVHVIKPNKKSIPFPFSIMGIDLLKKLCLKYCDSNISMTCKIEKIDGYEFIP